MVAEEWQRQAVQETPAGCGGETLPEGWPEDDATEEELLAPFLACGSPAEFLALQNQVDMSRVVEGLGEWSAVRLGAMGPLRQGASVLNRKRAAFLVSATERYGAAYSQVLALFVLHTAFDDELQTLVEQLARDKQLKQTLGQMGAVREELGRRGVKLEDWPERDEQPGDVLRGLSRAARDALATSPASEGARYTELTSRGAHLPRAYQQALAEVERELMHEHYAPGRVALSSFDQLTFGVPLGFYHLVEGAGRGVGKLAQGQYEQAARELAPAALLVAVYLGGKGARSFSEGRGSRWSHRQLPGAELRLRSLKEVAERLRQHLGEEGLRQLARYIQARREAAVLVGTGGEPAALALYAARGDVGRAQAVLSRAKPGVEAPTSSSSRAPEPLAGGGSAVGTLSADTPIRNAHLAGRRHPLTGVPFDGEGYPDFRAAGAVKVEVRITYTGSRARDFAEANKAAGLRETPKGMTWHHHQDRTTMQLVPTAIHAKTGHTGGFSGEP